MAKAIILVALSVFGSEAVFAQSLETLWRARGLEAVGKVKALEQKVKDKLSKEEQCQLLLEKGFAKFAKTDLGNAIQSRNGKMEILLLLDEKDKTAAITLVFDSQNKGEKSLIIAEPPWATAVANVMDQGSFAVRTKTCGFYFWVSDYINPTAGVMTP